MRISSRCVSFYLFATLVATKVLLQAAPLDFKTAELRRQVHAEPALRDRTDFMIELPAREGVRMSNSQVTDAVTQVNTRVLGESPAIAIASLYQATAQALSNAVHNATTSQQQSYVTAQASTIEGVMALYSMDTASTGVPTRKIFDESATAVQSAPRTELMASPDVQRLIDELSHETADVGYHVRSLMSAFAASLDALSIANSRQQLRILQNAAIAVCIKAMLEQPDKAREFEETLEIVKKVV